MRHLFFAFVLLAATACKNGADSQSSVSDSMFRNAVRNGDTELVATYLEDGYDFRSLGPGGENALHEGILHFNVAKLLIGAGIPVDKAHKFSGATPLIVSCIAENVEPRTVKLLLDNGADPAVVDSHGKTALDYAVEYDFKEKARILNKFSEGE